MNIINNITINNNINHNNNSHTKKNNNHNISTKFLWYSGYIFYMC